MHEQYMASENLPTTRGGNLAAPPLPTQMQWIVDAWRSISRETIVKSFKVCGITLATDGSEDAEFRLFKEDGPMAEGRDQLLAATAQLDADHDAIVNVVDASVDSSDSEIV